MELPHLYEIFPVTSPEASYESGMSFSLPDRSRQLISPLVGLSLSNAIVSSGSGIGSATSAFTTEPVASDPLPTRLLEQAYQRTPSERVNHTKNVLTASVPAFKIEVEGNQEPQPELPAWQLFEKSMLQALNPDAQVSDGTEQVALIQDSNSPHAVPRIESRERGIVLSNLHDLDFIQNYPGDLPKTAEFGKIPRSVHDVHDAFQLTPKPVSSGNNDSDELLRL